MTPAQKSKILKGLGQVIGGVLVVGGAWFSSHVEASGLVGDASNAATDAAAERVKAAEDQAADAERRLAEMREKARLSHNTNADVAKACTEAIGKLDVELHELMNDFNRLAGAVDAFHGHRRVAAIAEGIRDEKYTSHKPQVEVLDYEELELAGEEP